MTVVIDGTTGIDKVQDGSIGTADIAADAINSTKIDNTIPLGRRNIVINGNMRIAQRGSTRTGLSSSAYTVDRFEQTISSYGTWTHTREITGPSNTQFTRSLKTTCTTPDTSPGTNDYTRIDYKAEGRDLQHLIYGTSNAKDITISFWVKSNVVADYCFWIYQFDAPTPRHINHIYSINQADTWEYKTITIPGDTAGFISNDNGAGLMFAWMLSVGTGWSSGTRPSTWQAAVDANRWVGHTADVGGAADNYFQLTGVQIEVGSVATEFEYRKAVEEFSLCQRYYYRMNAIGNSDERNIGFSRTTTTCWVPYHFPVRMRAAPVVETTGTASDYSINVGQGTSTCTNFPVNNSTGKDGTMTSWQSTNNLTIGQANAVRFSSSDAFIAFNCEL